MFTMFLINVEPEHNKPCVCIELQLIQIAQEHGFARNIGTADVMSCIY